MDAGHCTSVAKTGQGGGGGGNGRETWTGTKM